MKKIFLILLTCLIVMGMQAQSDKPMQLASSSIPNKDAKYLLFPTQNFHIFLKLNTRTGEVYIVQFSLDGKEIEKKIFSMYYPLAIEEEQSNGRFFLYPTNNIFNFLLMDQVDGRVWQVQWNFDDDKCQITRIYTDKKALYENVKVLLERLDYRDNIYYFLDEMYNGIAYLDEEYTVGQLLVDGRIRYKDQYSAHHKTGKTAFIFHKGKEEDSMFYYDENGEMINKDVFMEKYPELLIKVKKVMESLKTKDQVKSNPVPSQVKRSPKK